ncbi:uncharacterized protein A1O5_08542 [Cladophialophora psammophila CBS 110553]|uniref:Xylanolytic transcriptional activator regulatory domain-containing protein n=1 Tax=Cladophialophora psammophila CBS 110553 TaxID=1182543 RepID=W9WLF3_9EURO|nr:uncharacterized protein A1O5_08542 [Cladophialophora psammophila CBS 110553]EXJ68748.1 hypothetical protein A1O5_08542 [Cladophialophora psammophila CBS 110553]
MPAMIGVETNELRRQEPYGSSSAGSFIQHVRKVVEQKTASPSTVYPSGTVRDQDNNPLMVPNVPCDKAGEDSDLPGRKRADSLFAVYWQFVHSLYPFLGRRMTTADYENLWKGNGLIPHERSFLCLLNLIFALASQLSPSIMPSERAASAAVFHTRAKHLLDLENTASVRYVQIYLLFGLYLQSTHEAHQCWVFVALAIRTAQSLELHMPETNERPSNSRMRSLLRRVWHGCVLMDRVLAMAYGRPCMIDRRVALSVPLSLAVEGEEMSPDPAMLGSTSPAEQPALGDFFNQSMLLYGILHDVLVNFYSPQAPHVHSLDDVYHHYFEGYHRPRGELDVLEIDRKLSRWKKELPRYLEISNYPLNQHPVTVLSRQAVILHQRFLHVRLLSLRPVLSAFITFDNYEKQAHPCLETFLSRRVIFQCCLVCVKVAQESIDLIDKRRTEDPGAATNLAAWWYNVLFLYTSATVLVAARISPFILAEISESTILDSWRKVMEGLDHFSVFGSSIKRLVTTLKLLFETVPHQFSRLRQFPAENNMQQQFRDAPTTVIEGLQERLVDGRHMASSRPISPSFFDRNVPESNLLDFDPGDSLGLIAAFDTNDMSWLTTVPFEM